MSFRIYSHLDRRIRCPYLIQLYALAFHNYSRCANFRLSECIISRLVYHILIPICSFHRLTSRIEAYVGDFGFTISSSCITDNLGALQTPAVPNTNQYINPQSPNKPFSSISKIIARAKTIRRGARRCNVSS